jgi:deoxyhypusine synthase
MIWGFIEVARNIAFLLTPKHDVVWLLASESLTQETPIYVIESDATIVAPLVLTALLEARQDPKAADALIARYGF